ncbi:hypothetical protein NEOLI_003334 [Neolecta irregularis DAH-3]|uniref:Btz domain-containing protein n=1 Tax=Neolecta irregularis (strain DAH-3) TaxID=1198029 RepID=A0A1U7LGZ3_NEOID|nr:hypothetical protein NEOLI_003334 [Neolecta irregularis DAH-3]|eukprot:OLL21926.1 hypothetical protein NEOLI_003334 [Neolecta irregularis DAH-3]
MDDHPLQDSASEDEQGFGSDSENSNVDFIPKSRLESNQLDWSEIPSDPTKQTPSRETAMFSSSRETKEMLNGMSTNTTPVENIHFEDLSLLSEENVLKKNRQEYTSRAARDPTFVPYIGSFFMHDSRNRKPVRETTKGRGKRGKQTKDPSDERWKHDAFDPLETRQKPTSRPPSKPKTANNTVCAQINLPNVTVIESLVIDVRRHYVRPARYKPLRADLPVQICLPGQPIKKVYPASENSYEPNQFTRKDDARPNHHHHHHYKKPSSPDVSATNPAGQIQVHQPRPTRNVQIAQFGANHPSVAPPAVLSAATPPFLHKQKTWGHLPGSAVYAAPFHPNTYALPPPYVYDTNNQVPSFSYSPVSPYMGYSPMMSGPDMMENSMYYGGDYWYAGQSTENAGAYYYSPQSTPVYYPPAAVQTVTPPITAGGAGDKKS